jgi:hypothetical protein
VDACLTHSHTQSLSSTHGIPCVWGVYLGPTDRSLVNRPAPTSNSAPDSWHASLTRNATYRPRPPNAHTHTCTSTHTQRCTSTHTHTHTHAQAYTHRDAQVHTHRCTSTHTHIPDPTPSSAVKKEPHSLHRSCMRLLVCLSMYVSPCLLNHASISLSLSHTETHFHACVPVALQTRD